MEVRDRDLWVREHERKSVERGWNKIVSNKAKGCLEKKYKEFCFILF